MPPDGANRVSVVEVQRPVLPAEIVIKVARLQQVTHHLPGTDHASERIHGEPAQKYERRAPAVVAAVSSFEVVRESQATHHRFGPGEILIRGPCGKLFQEGGCISAQPCLNPLHAVLDSCHLILLCQNMNGEASCSSFLPESNRSGSDNGTTFLR